MESWTIGPLNHWSIGLLVHWFIGPLVRWFLGRTIGPLVQWSIVQKDPQTDVYSSKVKEQLTNDHYSEEVICKQYIFSSSAFTFIDIEPPVTKSFSNTVLPGQTWSKPLTKAVKEVFQGHT